MMEVIDINNEIMEEVEVLGHIGLFTELRVDKTILPEGVYCYELRHGDDNGFPATMEENVTVNYFGAVIFMDKMELDAQGYLPLEYDDFCFTGEQMKAVDFFAQSRCEAIQSADGLVDYLDENDMLLHMTEQEASIVLGYMEGSGYLLGTYQGELYRGDPSKEQGKIRWESYSIDDAIDNACEWNYQFILQTQNEKENSHDFDDFISRDAYHQSLRKDGQVLDALFDRTKYGDEIKQLAEKLAEEFIKNMNLPGGLDGAVERIKEGLSEINHHIDPACLQEESGKELSEAKSIANYHSVPIQKGRSK